MPPDTHTALTFDSKGDTCAAWLTRPAGPGPHPGLVLVHGFGANHTMSLQQYEHHFSQAGIATLAFDYRGLGASGGFPRQRLSLRRHRQDVVAALQFLAGLPDIDAGRIGLWGTSLGAMHALQVAAARDEVAAVVVQCPIVDGPAVVRRMGLSAMVRQTPAILNDAARRVLGRTPHYVPIVGPAGSAAAVTAPGALEGWNGTVSPGGSFDNRVGASDVAEIAITSATRTASRITAPTLVCVSDRETLMDPHRAEDIARRAPRGEARHYDADHFDVYHPPLLAQLLADQTAFLRKHLNVGHA
ncbi:pimeloyl-ACP methyl ester carboxylesterase [Mycolicibacterium sp. BK556]|uniref:alpha/beta hydrolase n=1 Tax=Mycobacteriaceae TaxID=1762 RepID=UPI0010607E48|nr:MULTISPECIES: alpha/beta fold hydrolase [Mycobacteriaceae]MBB3603241.1 pimeloyl-ACP methyl ester carboxylesterase [Mycolicibacterium sp. BK556]MBB3633436.1 pimeloyl-ACP methyl ester carboxylesterase [Mycolicibacterium sp. BK607]MBB3751009.1 pimeloyl-ACP methyl ester carboxylesterase [Mycolicibacterium sp. BK634]TDO07408.1 serine aminopeptidase S33 family [Mycobacterium sp. BK086]